MTPSTRPNQRAFFARSGRGVATATATAGGLLLALAAGASGTPTPDRPAHGTVVTAAEGHNSVADQPASVTGTCFWGEPLNVEKPEQNILGPDTHVGYWYDRFVLPAGARIVLTGEFPHARFMSLTSYGTVAGQRGTALGAYSDVQIKPDAGSVNPFLPGERRTAKNRSFTMTLNGDVDPGAAHRAPNTFYVGQAGQTGAAQTIEIIYRIYRADKNLDMAGGVPLPEPTLVLADGQKFTGEAACEKLEVVTDFDKIDTTGIGLPVSTYLNLLKLPGAKPTHPAVEEVVWDRFFNLQYLLAPFFRGTALESRISTFPTDIRPGLYPTPANAYISTTADRSFGPDPDGHNILVLRAKMPTHPTTFRHDPLNTSGGKQVRYWSLCNYGGLANPPLTPANGDCLFDQQVPVDKDGFFTVVVSLAEDRPANAVARCGVAWLDWTEKGDAVPGGNNRLISLVVRNMLPDPSFDQAIANVLTPGTEKQVLGEYYPVGTYLSPEQFERRGCPSRS